MTVAELREILTRHEPDRIVVLARDREGNEYSPAEVLDVARYRPVTSWHGYLPGDDDVCREDLQAVVLWPVN